MSVAYLDNSATTQVIKPAADAAYRVMTECYGNPSSLHTLGFLAEQEVTKARKAIATLLKCDASSIIFTSGGTESNNLAILGSAEANKRKGNHIVTSAIEHPSVLNTCKRLEKLGYDVTYVMPEPDGTISESAALNACTPSTILISIMLVNNETGAVFNWEKAAKTLRKKFPNALLHCDAVQAFGKLPISLKKTDVDLLSCSGHKIGASKGIGALYIKPNVRLILPSAYGGGQEKGIRSGTENVPGIAAFGEAVSHLPSMEEQNDLYSMLRQEIIQTFNDTPDILFHCPQNGVPYVLHLSVLGRKSETLVHFLAEKNIYVSGGSACSKGKKSHVLEAMNLPAKEIDSSLRISFGPQNSKQDAQAFIQGLKQAMESIACSR